MDIDHHWSNKKNVKTWNKSPLLCFLTRGMCKIGHWKRWNFWKIYWKVWFSSKWWTETSSQITYYRIPNLVMFFSNFSIKKIKDKENLLFLNSLQLFEDFKFYLEKSLWFDTNHNRGKICHPVRILKPFSLSYLKKVQILRFFKKIVEKIVFNRGDDGAL